MSARLPLILLAALLAVLAAAPTARADDLDDAEVFAAAGDKDKARAALGAWLEGDDDDDETLLRAAQLARSLPDIELLRSARARAEAAEADAGEASATLNLALGFAYLGLAEENLRLRTMSRSISLYFADALTRATAIPATSPHGETAARLAAGVRFAQGDLPAAVAGLDAFRTKTEVVSPRFEALHGRLQYELGAAKPLLASGHVTPEGRTLLTAAIRALTKASAATALPAPVRRASMLQLAYAHHRLGAIDQADAAYRGAFAPGAREARLVVRGLASLHARNLDRHLATLSALRAAHPRALTVLDALAAAYTSAGRHADTLIVAERRVEVAPDDPASWSRAGHALFTLGLSARAVDYWTEALHRDANLLRASYGMELAARKALASDPDRARAIYELLISLRPGDPYTRNNYGFILRDLVSKHTDKLKGGLERISADAPENTLSLLKRCVEVYAEATAAIDPAQDSDLDELTAWNLAGIINDYGLMLHYFVDAQDAALAEQQYLRALRMTDYGFKDTYGPNLHRLYRYVLTDVDHAWRWYRIAREAQHSILAEAKDERGALVLVPDERKRAAARRDMEAARARILQVLELDAGEDGLPWPPAKENGNDR